MANIAGVMQSTAAALNSDCRQCSVVLHLFYCSVQLTVVAERCVEDSILESESS